MKFFSSTLLFLIALGLTSCGALNSPKSHSVLKDIELPEELVRPFDGDKDGVTLSKDHCPETPPNEIKFVDDRGCTGADPDGDGVKDPIDRCPETPRGESVFKDSGCMDHYYIVSIKMNYIRFEGGSLENMKVGPTVPYETSRAEAQKMGEQERSDLLKNQAHYFRLDVEPPLVTKVPFKRHFCRGDECKPNKSLKDVGKRSGLDFGDAGSGLSGSDSGSGAGSGPDSSPNSSPSPGGGSGPNGGGSGGGSSAPGSGSSPGGQNSGSDKPSAEVKDIRPASGGNEPEFDEVTGEEPLSRLEENAHGSFGFQTPFNSVEGKNLARVAHLIRVVNERPVSAVGPIASNAVSGFTDEAGNSLYAADDLYAVGNKSEGNAYLYMASLFAEAAYDILTSEAAIEIATIGGPLAMARDAYEAATGVDLANRASLSSTERALRVVGLLSGGLGSKIVKAGAITGQVTAIVGVLKKLSQRAGRADDLETVAKEVATVQKVASELRLEKSDDLLEFSHTHAAQTVVEGRVKSLDLEDGFKQFDKAVSVSNPFPANGEFARVIKKADLEKILSGERDMTLPFTDVRGVEVTEAFITAFEDIKTIRNPEELAKKLSLFSNPEGNVLRDMTDHVILKFKFNSIEQAALQSPFETADNLRKYGFLPGGKTAGGAREWLVDSRAIKNKLIDKNSMEVLEIVR